MTLSVQTKAKVLILLPAAVIFVLASFLSGLFYVRSTRLTEQQIKNHIRSLAVAAAASLDAGAIHRIHSPADMRSGSYVDTVDRLNAMRDADNAVAYAYVLRQDARNVVTFVADADSLKTPQELDTNKNGVVDDEEKPSLPGDVYDAAHMPDLLRGFAAPSVDADFTHDAWGTFVSGYAPVKDKNGKPVGLVGLDIRADTFIRDSRNIFSPIALAVVLALGGFCALLVLFAQVRQRYAMLRQLEESKSHFLTASSHQLRTPLTTIRWTFDSLPENGPLTGEQRKMLQDAQTASLQMAETIDTMLHIATIESGKQNVRASGVFVLTLLRELVQKTQPEWQAKNLAVSVECAEHVRSLTDEKIAKEILTELIRNAIWYTPEGGRITLAAAATPTGVRFIITDTGIGIPAEEQGSIFSKFYRSERAQRMHPTGDGLGLYLAQSLVSILGGTIDCVSVVDQGSIFRVQLPDAYL